MRRVLSGFSARAEKRLLAGLALIVAIAVVVAIVLLTRSPSSNPRAAADTISTGAATVERRDLVQTDTESGTLGYARPQTVYNRLQGTITSLPRVGKVVHPGQPLFSIDNRPVILMNGATPAYRNLSASDVKGPDVLELNRNLIALGFNPDGIVDDDVWQTATTAGVEQFQASLGESQTGVLSLGQVVFLPGPQLVSTVDGTVGSTGGGASNPSSTSTSYEMTGAHTEFVDLTTPQTTTTGTGTTPTGTGTTTTGTGTTTTPTRTTPGSSSGGHPGKHSRPSKHQHKSASLSALVALLRAEVQELRAEQHSPGSTPSSHGTTPSAKPSSANPSGGTPSNGSSPSSNSSSHSPSNSTANGGAGAGNATEILQTSSPRLVVTVQLPASSQSEAVRGEHVTVEMPDGRTVRGVISAVSPVAQSSSSDTGSTSSPGTGTGGSSATIPVTVRLLGHVSGAGLDQASVSVNFAQAKARNVLSVPVTALIATSGAHYAVQQASAPHKLIPVKTGLFAAGFVEISGPGIHQGLQVTDSQG